MRHSSETRRPCKEFLFNFTFIRCEKFEMCLLVIVLYYPVKFSIIYNLLISEYTYNCRHTNHDPTIIMIFIQVEFKQENHNTKGAKGFQVSLLNMAIIKLTFPPPGTCLMLSLEPQREVMWLKSIFLCTI